MKDKTEAFDQGLVFQLLPVCRSNLGGLSSLPQQLESECTKVKKQVCKDVPKKEPVMKEVEICVRKPKEVDQAQYRFS